MSFKKEVLRRYAEESGVASVKDGGARADQGGGGWGGTWAGRLGLPSRCERLRPSQGFCSPALPFITSQVVGLEHSGALWGLRMHQGAVCHPCALSTSSMATCPALPWPRQQLLCASHTPRFQGTLRGGGQQSEPQPHLCSRSQGHDRPSSSPSSSTILSTLMLGSLHLTGPHGTPKVVTQTFHLDESEPLSMHPFTDRTGKGAAQRQPSKSQVSFSTSMRESGPAFW